jgi:hypothetical protein
MRTITSCPLFEAARAESQPILATFAGCCASAVTPRASNTTATRIDSAAAFFIVHLVSSVMYHAETRGLSNKNYWRNVNLTCQTNEAQDWFVKKFSSILAVFTRLEALT